MPSDRRPLSVERTAVMSRLFKPKPCTVDDQHLMQLQGEPATSILRMRAHVPASQGHAEFF